MLTIADEVHEQQWGWSEELLATIAELLHELLRTYMAVHSKKGTKLPPRLEIPRPNREQEVVEQVTITRHTYRRALLGGGMPDGF